MRHCRMMVGCTLALVFVSAIAPDQVKPVIAHCSVADATAQFKFPDVPSPSSSDIATGRRFVIVDGEPDPNGAGVSALTDGRVPSIADSPADNFFFEAGTDGGRLRLDLGSAIDVKQVNTYSWHTGNRAPQVYKLYAADGKARKFNSAPLRGVDPTACGWKLIADVDTRPPGGGDGIGGQYGVSIGDAKLTVAHCAYLLFDVRATEQSDEFGNTFYSEIDVVSGDELLKPASVREPTAQFSFGDVAQYQVSIDASDAPELKAWATALEPIVRKWYPILVKSLPSKGYVATPRFSIVFNDKPGVAYTAGGLIVCASGWFDKHRDDQGAIVHEMVHVAQQYRRGGNPSWLVEGIADYFRWFVYEPAVKQPHPDFARAHYTDSYRTTAAFLNYVVNNADKHIVVEMNAAMRAGKYSPDLWKQYTGKTADELWNEYAASTQSG